MAAAESNLPYKNTTLIECCLSPIKGTENLNNSADWQQTSRRKTPVLNIRSEHLDVQLIKYLYKVYFNKKILRSEMRARMAQESGIKGQQMDTGNSLLRVTYFDDFYLFRGDDSEALKSSPQPMKYRSHSQPNHQPTINNAARAASTNDLDTSSVTLKEDILSPPSRRVAKSGQVSSELSHGSSLKTTRTTKSSTISSSGQFESGRSQVNDDEDEEFQKQFLARMNDLTSEDGVSLSKHSSNSSVIVLTDKEAADLDYDTDVNPDDLIDDSNSRDVKVTVGGGGEVDEEHGNVVLDTGSRKM